MLDINLTLLWQFLNFLIVMFVLNAFLFKPVGAVLKKRQEDIQKLYDAIDSDKKAALALKEIHDEQIKKIEIEIAELKRTAIKEAQAQKDEILEEARQEAQAVVNKGLEKVKNETQKELDKLQDYVADLSVNIAGKILKQEIDKSKHKQMIDEFIQKVGEIEWQKR